jgi:hypothetical protein
MFFPSHFARPPDPEAILAYGVTDVRPVPDEVQIGLIAPKRKIARI